MIHTYRKKPVDVQAIKWTGNNLREIIDPLNPATAGYQCTNINCPAVEASEPCAYEEECQHPACNCGPSILPFNKECPKCRTKDFASCHSMHCPVRKPVESSEPQEKEPTAYQKRKAIEKRAVWLKYCLDIGWTKDQLDGLEKIWDQHHDEFGNLIKGVSAPSESQEELWQSSNPNKERYVQLSNVHSDGMPEPWLRFWEQIEIWYGDIQKRETGVQLLERLRKEGFKITRNP